MDHKPIIYDWETLLGDHRGYFLAGFAFHYDWATEGSRDGVGVSHRAQGAVDIVGFLLEVAIGTFIPTALIFVSKWK